MNTTRTFRFRLAEILLLCLALAVSAAFAAGPVQIPNPKGKPPIHHLVGAPTGGDGSSPWPVARILSVPGSSSVQSGWDALHLGDRALVTWSEADGKDREIALVVTPSSGTPQRYQLTRNASPDLQPGFTQSSTGQVALVWLRASRAGETVQGSVLDPVTMEPGPERLLLRLDPAVVEVSAALLPNNSFVFARTVRRDGVLSVEAGDPAAGFLPLIQLPSWPGYACWLVSGSMGELYLSWAQDAHTIGLFVRGLNGHWSGPEYFSLN